LEYVALQFAERKLNFVTTMRLGRVIRNISEWYDSEVEHLGKVFDPDRSKIPDLSEPWDAFRAAHFDIIDGKRNYRFETHANAEVHYQYYQWLQTLEGMSAEAVKAEFDAAVKEENEHSLSYYRREVDELLKGYKDTFERQMRKAKDREFLFSEQIGWWTYVLMPDKAENVRSEWERDYNTNLHFQKLRHESGSIRVGKGVPSIVRKPELKRQHPQHEAEARLEFLQWLKTLQATSKPVTDTPTTPQDKEGSTWAEIEPKPKAIIFTDPNTITAIHEGLKAFFPERENDLLRLLKGGAVDNPLHFADQQNKLAEVFSRAYYNGKLGGNKTEVQNWIAANFTYQNKRTKEKTHFSLDTLRGIFNPTGKGEAKKGKRITIAGLEYIAPEKREGYVVK
jgi:hypothetical protein